LKILFSYLTRTQKAVELSNASLFDSEQEKKASILVTAMTLNYLVAQIHKELASKRLGGKGFVCSMYVAFTLRGTLSDLVFLRDRKLVLLSSASSLVIVFFFNEFNKKLKHY